jgi:hypothetical protein
MYGYGGKADVGSREEASAVAKRIKEREQHDEKLGYEYRGNVADSAIFAETGAQKSIGNIFRESGVKWLPCYKGPRSRVIGAQLVVELLRNGKLKIFRTCTHLIRTVPALMPDDNNPEDVNTKMEDHAFDCLKYGLQSRRANPVEEQKSEDGQFVSYKDETETYTMRVN